VFLDKFPSVCDSRVSGGWGVVKRVEDLSACLWVVGEEGFLDHEGGKGGKKMIGEQGAW